MTGQEPEADLALLTAECFEVLLAQAFQLQLPEGETLTMQLSELRRGAATAQATRTGFALTFHCTSLSDGRYLRQGSYRFSHPALGAMTLFTTPTAPDARGVRYEVIFG